MNAAIHFISGLPRAGSTLLSALLQQNPRFHASMTGPVGSMVVAMLRNMSMRNENAVFVDDETREAVIKGLFTSFYRDVPAGDVVFDTNRMWCSKLPLLTSIFPKTKVICCVRDLPDVYDSIERLVRKNKFQPSGIFGFESSGTVYSRVEHLSGGGMVGFAWNALREAFCGDQSDMLLALTYRKLTTDPKGALDAVYDFIGEPRFEHDFDNVTFDAGVEFDKKLGTPGLHSVGRKVKFERRPPVLPPDLIRRFAHDSFWLDPSRNPNKVLVV